jgi:hypothetical protein
MRLSALSPARTPALRPVGFRPSHNELKACPSILEREVPAGGIEVIALSAWEMAASGPLGLLTCR